MEKEIEIYMKALTAMEKITREDPDFNKKVDEIIRDDSTRFDSIEKLTGIVIQLDKRTIAERRRRIIVEAGSQKLMEDLEEMTNMNLALQSDVKILFKIYNVLVRDILSFVKTVPKYPGEIKKEKKMNKMRQNLLKRLENIRKTNRKADFLRIKYGI